MLLLLLELIKFLKSLLIIVQKKNHHPRESKISSFVQEKTSGRVFWGKSPLCNPNRERAGPNNVYMFP